jgi:hypothetical protein
MTAVRDDSARVPAAHYLCPVCHARIAVEAGATELRCTGCTLVAPLSRVGTAPGVALPIAIDRAGTAVGAYQLGERIGTGGMGTVYRAVGPDDVAVAVKLLHPDATRGELSDRLRREGEVLRRLIHPRVVRLIDVGDADGAPYLVTELVEGQDLAAILAARRPSLAEAIGWLIDVCAGVAAAHAAGIVHRDLKPANVLIDRSGTAKVVDFGLALLPGDAVATLTRTDVALGTINYLAPEQRRSASTVDGRADVYALGVMFYELVTGDLPLGRFPLPSERGFPRACDAVVERALAPDPAARFPTVDAFAAALATVIRPPRRRGIALVAATIAVAGVASAGLAMAGVFSKEPALMDVPTTNEASTLAIDGGAGGGEVAAAGTDGGAVVDAGVDAGLVAAATVDAGVRPPEKRPSKRPVSKPSKRPAGPPGKGKGKQSKPIDID